MTRNLRFSTLQIPIELFKSGNYIILKAGIPSNPKPCNFIVSISFKQHVYSIRSIKYRRKDAIVRSWNMVCVAWKAGLTECRLSKKGEVRKAVKIALQTGYTHIDCALIYGNESEVGEGIKDWGGDRSKIWVTSKLWNHQHNPSEVSKGLETTLKDLQLEYIDLYDPLIM